MLYESQTYDFLIYYITNREGYLIIIKLINSFLFVDIKYSHYEFIPTPPQQVEYGIGINELIIK